MCRFDDTNYPLYLQEVIQNHVDYIENPQCSKGESYDLLRYGIDFSESEKCITKEQAKVLRSRYLY